MGQCFGKEMIHLRSFKSWMSRTSSQHDVLRNTDEEDDQGITAGEKQNGNEEHKRPRRLSNRRNKSFIRIFSLTKARRKYDIQDNDEVELPEIESKEEDAEGEEISFEGVSEPPDVAQVAGLRNNPITCAFYSGKERLLRNSMKPGGIRSGNRFMILDPRGLSHQCPEALSSSDEMEKDKGRHRSSNSSLDLEWEPEASMMPFVKKNNQKDSPMSAKHHHYASNDNVSHHNNVESIASTVAPETRNSEVSSQNSIPGLDWDSQSDNDLMTNGLESLEMELETEQLITEIEQLTNRALQETNQWSSSLPSSPKNMSTKTFHKYRGSSKNHTNLSNGKSSLNNASVIMYEETNGNNGEVLSNPGH